MSQTVLGRTQVTSAHASGLVTVPFLGAGLLTYVRERKTKGKKFVPKYILSKIYLPVLSGKSVGTQEMSLRSWLTQQDK